jgi:uncharacterized protein (DUF1015 family)
MTAASTTEPPRPSGLVLEPFRALRYSSSSVRDLAGVTSPPYDVIDAEGIEALERRDPHNVVRLILPRDEPGQDGSRYRVAARTLGQWRREGVLVLDDVPAVYVYEERVAGHVQRGLVGLVRLAAPDAGIVLPHENTMAGPVADRLALTAATQANLEPIFLVYDGTGGETSSIVAGAGDHPALFTTTTDDGVTHTVWSVTDEDILDAIRADLLPRRAVIADGHHRYATYLRYQADRRAAGAGAGPWDLGLALVVDAAAFGPQVHAIHRVVPSLPLERAVAAAARGFTVKRIDRDGGLDALREAGRHGHAYLLVGDGQWHLLTDPDPDQLRESLPADRSEAWRSLDVVVAHRLLVGRLWQLADREDVVGFAHDVDEALRRAGTGVALLCNPTPVQAVAAVAAAGDRMPRKSTLFTPKPRSGLLIRSLPD